MKFAVFLALAGFASAQSAVPRTSFPESASRKAAADRYVDRAVQITRRIEERVQKADRVIQPVAWARLFALWYDSGDRKALQRQLNFTVANMELDQELECGQIRDPWLARALEGISRRGETPTQRRQRVASAAMVLGVLAPYGKGISNCVLVELQSKKRELNDSRPTLREEHELVDPALEPIGDAAQRLAMKEGTFTRAVRLAHMAIQLRSARPLTGFMQVAFAKHAEVAAETMRVAFESIEQDWDPIFVAELGGVVFPPSGQDGALAADQARYLEYLEKATSVALQDSTRSESLCTLAGVGWKLVARLNLSRAPSLTSAIQMCGLTTPAGDDLNRSGQELRSVSDYLRVANTTSDLDRRVRLKMTAADLAIESDPVQAVDIMRSVTTEERNLYSGSWRKEAESLAKRAALKLYERNDFHGIEVLLDRVPNSFKAFVQIEVAKKALTLKSGQDFARYMTQQAHRTLKDSEPQDSTVLVEFANTAARALEREEAERAVSDTLKWIDGVPHAADFWRSPAKAQEETLSVNSTREIPVQIGKFVKPVEFVASMASIPVDSSVIRDDSDAISIDLGMVQLTLEMARNARTLHGVE